MLTQLFNVKDIRKNVKGIALGEFSDIENTEMLDEVIMETALSLNLLPNSTVSLNISDRFEENAFLSPENLITSVVFVFCAKEHKEQKQIKQNKAMVNTFFIFKF